MLATTTIADPSDLALLPPFLDEGIQIACVVLPLLSLLISALIRCFRPKTVDGDGGRTANPLLNGDAARSDMEAGTGGTQGAARSEAQREADRSLENEIKKRASLKNGT